MSVGFQVMFRDKTRRRGVSLLELLVVITLLGIMASVAAMRFGRSLLSEFGAHAEARQLSLALLACQRAAVKTGDDHVLRLKRMDGGRALSYQILHNNAGTLQLVDGPRSFPAMGPFAVHTATCDSILKAPRGAYQIQLRGQPRRWQIDVVPVTGSIRVTDTS